MAIMLLVEIDINGTTHRVSRDGYALEHLWRPKVVNFDTPMRTIQSDHGGYCELTFGQISFLPDLFTSDDWPPPVSCPVTFYCTATTEAAQELISPGTLHLDRITRDEIVYNIHGPAYDETTAEDEPFDDTLDDVLEEILTGISEITSLNTDYARASPPPIDYTVGSEIPNIQLAAAIAAYATHLIYIVEPVAYLVDMLLDNGSRTLTGFQYFPSEYWRKDPLYKVLATVGEDEAAHVDATYPYGRQETISPYHDTAGTVETQLSNILTIENKSRCTLQMPFKGAIPAPGEKISWTDTSLEHDADCYIRARTIRYNFLDDLIEVEGEGVLS